MMAMQVRLLAHFFLSFRSFLSPKISPENYFFKADFRHNVVQSPAARIDLSGAADASPLGQRALTEGEGGSSRVPTPPPSATESSVSPPASGAGSGGAPAP
jgi:hypothetical protein